jgi:hypothetical protein
MNNLNLINKLKQINKYLYQFKHLKPKAEWFTYKYHNDSIEYNKHLFDLFKTLGCYFYFRNGKNIPYNFYLNNKNIPDIYKNHECPQDIMLYGSKTKINSIEKALLLNPNTNNEILLNIGLYTSDVELYEMILKILETKNYYHESMEKLVQRKNYIVTEQDNFDVIWKIETNIYKLSTGLMNKKYFKGLNSL